MRILALGLALTTPVLAAEDVQQPPKAAAPGGGQAQAQRTGVPTGGAPQYRRFHLVLARNLTSNLFVRQNLAPFLIGAGGALAIAPADHEITRSLRNHAREFGATGQYVGGIAVASFVGGAVLVSCGTKSERYRSFSYTLAQAYATSAILTESLKLATHRMRPDGSASTSFPSGHVSNTFAVATVVSGYYGRRWGIPLYVLSTLVGVSRVEKGNHWASDVIAGAALGYISGQTAIRGTKRELAGKNAVSGLIVMPVYGRGLRGVAVRFFF